MRCPTCGADVDADDYWCEACATRLDTGVSGEGAPESVPALVSAAGPPPPKPTRYVPPPPPAGPPIPVVQQPGTAAPSTLVFPYSLMRVSRWWLLIGPAVVVIAFVVAAMTMIDNDVDHASAPREPFELYTAPSGAFAVHISFEKVVPVEGGVVITDTLAANGNAATLYDGPNEYRLTEVELPGRERPRGIDHCRINAPDAKASDGMVDGHAATLCRWEKHAIYHSEAYVRRGDRVFLIEHTSPLDDDDRFRDLLAGFEFMD